MDELLLESPRRLEDLVANVIPLVSPGIAYRHFLSSRIRGNRRYARRINARPASDPVLSGARAIVKTGISTSVARGAYLREGDMIFLARRPCSCPHGCKVIPARGRVICSRCRASHPLKSGG